MKKLTFALACLIFTQAQGSLSKKTLLQDSVITQRQLKEIAAEAKTPAIQIAYLADGKITHYNYGVKDITTNEAIGNNTVFQAASLSKIVATYAFLVLVDKGLLDLDKPLWSYYEYDRLKDDPYKELMTARMVLTHHTGLPNWEKGKKGPLSTRFKPGTDYMYSGEAYQYLQLVAEKITGKSLDEICSTYIFKPFGMKKSHFTYTDLIGQDISIGHTDAVTSYGKVQKFTTGNSAFTLYTTAEEYMKFLVAAVLEGKGLSKQMHKDFLTPYVTTVAKGKEKERDKHVKCCFGIRTQENEAGLAYWHTGSNGGGYRCIFIIYPEGKKAITLFTNSNLGTATFLPVLNTVFGADQTYWSIKK